MEQEISDVLLLSFDLASNFIITIVNIYNASSGTISFGPRISFLLSLTDLYLHQESIFVDDFNLRHKNWHPKFRGSISS